ncbi:hypothetical protein [Ekhidna sp.]|uniref:hypothetical protein n=1 Tax=Ekhidna sp. TaxID=2608089 RepID=UPI003298ED61
MIKKLNLLTITLILSQFGYSQNLSKEDLLGSYQLKKIDYIYSDTTITVSPSQSGFLVLAPLRYAIAYNPGLNPRKAFENLSSPTEEEILAGFRSFAFNSGAYTYTEGTFKASPDFAKVPGFEGGEQVYEVNYIDGLYSFNMFDETYPGGEKPSWYGKLKIKLYFEKEQSN